MSSREDSISHYIKNVCAWLCVSYRWEIRTLIKMSHSRPGCCKSDDNRLSS